LYTLKNKGFKKGFQNNAKRGTISGYPENSSKMNIFPFNLNNWRVFFHNKEPFFCNCRFHGC